MARETDKTLKDQILWVLEHYPPSRNCDQELTAVLWAKFYSQHLMKSTAYEGHTKTNRYGIEVVFFESENGQTTNITVSKDFLAMPPGESVKRQRAAIQNDEDNPQFPPTSIAVIRARRMNEEKIRNHYAKKGLMLTV